MEKQQAAAEQQKLQEQAQQVIVCHQPPNRQVLVYELVVSKLRQAMLHNCPDQHRHDVAAKTIASSEHAPGHDSHAFIGTEKHSRLLLLSQSRFTWLGGQRCPCT